MKALIKYSKYSDKEMEVIAFYRSTKLKVNHSKRLKVTGQGEILASQDFDCGHRLTYSARICDTPLPMAIYSNISKIIQNIFSGVQVGSFIKDDSIYNMMIVACQAIVC